MTSAIIWSKDNCVYCEKAKYFFQSKNIVYEVRNISSSNWSKEQLLEVVPDAKTVPQIFIDGEYIGGYDNLIEKIG